MRATTPSRARENYFATQLRWGRGHRTFLKGLVFGRCGLKTRSASELQANLPRPILETTPNTFNMNVTHPHRSPESVQQSPDMDGAFRQRQYPNCYACLPPNRSGSVCPHTGLRHAHLAKLLKPGGQAAKHVRVVALREPGARRGKTLFHVGDMLQWLDGLASSQAPLKDGEGTLRP